MIEDIYINIRINFQLVLINSIILHRKISLLSIIINLKTILNNIESIKLNKKRSTEKKVSYPNILTKMDG